MGFWSNIFHEINCNTVLELACGTGRLAHIFLREGVYYTGLELHSEFTKAAQKKLEIYGDKASLICGNMCEFDLNKKFDLIFIGFNSFLHLLTDNEVENCFHCIKKQG